MGVFGLFEKRSQLGEECRLRPGMWEMDREADKRKRNGERCPASLRMAAKYLKRGYKPRDRAIGGGMAPVSELVVKLGFVGNEEAPGRGEKSAGTQGFCVYTCDVLHWVLSGFDWDKDNTAHIARHGVSRREVEEVFSRSHAIEMVDPVNDGERFLAHGTTASGRYLTVVFTERKGLTRRVTTWEMTRKDREQYADEIH
jgi:uncharacterized DUF497 family protein